MQNHLEDIAGEKDYWEIIHAETCWIVNTGYITHYCKQEITCRADADVWNSRKENNAELSMSAGGKTMEWQSIETAPKNKRVLLGFSRPVFNGVSTIVGQWNEDSYAKKPPPILGA